jgi:hypothetical protein
VDAGLFRALARLDLVVGLDDGGADELVSLLKISTGLREAGDFDEPAVPSRSW